MTSPPGPPKPCLGFYSTVRDTSLNPKPLDDIAAMVLEGTDGLTRLTAEAHRLYCVQEEAYRVVGSPEKPDRQDPAHAAYYKAYDGYKSAKDRFPAVTFSGTFKDRTDATMIAHSGLIGVDLDHLARAGLDPEAVRAAAAAMPFTAFVFVSPSGDGVKAFALVSPIPKTDAEHRRAYDQVVQAYAAVAPVDVSDKVCKNPLSPVLPGPRSRGGLQPLWRGLSHWRLTSPRRRSHPRRRSRPRRPIPIAMTTMPGWIGRPWLTSPCPMAEAANTTINGWSGSPL